MKTWNGRHVGMMAVCCGLGLVMTDLSFSQQPATEAQQAQQRAQQAQQQQGEKQFCLASELIGMQIKAKGEEQVGKIGNLIINQQGQVQYLAMSAGATDESPSARGQQDRAAAAGGKLTLVPWQMAKLHAGSTPAQSYVAVDIEKEKLTKAPSFTARQLSAAQNQTQVVAQVNQFFNVRQQRGAARPELDSDDEQRQTPRGTPPERDDQ